MKRLEVTRDALTISVVLALLTACGGGQPPTGAPAVSSQGRTTSSWSYTVLHRFKNGSRRRKSHGSSIPTGALVDVNGALYGTTAHGGGSDQCSKEVVGQLGCGTVYRMSTRGSYSVMYKFPGGAGNGAQPVASLINVKGTLYGATRYGGDYVCLFQGLIGCGTVYSMTASGVVTLLHSFGNGRDGAYPATDLTYLNGTLYGTTSGGGYGCLSYRSGCGVVYSVTTSGDEKVLFTFGYSGPFAPSSGLTNVNGTLYGVTARGGVANCSGGCGVVYKITTTRHMKILYSFAGGSDGANPYGDLLNVHGVLYGTTSSGGSGCNCGTVFRVNTRGEERVLYAFKGGSDGSEPDGLINVNGSLFGTTSLGGGTGCQGFGCGVVYSVSTSGAEEVLYSFLGGTDGIGPSRLVDVKGTLYGTTTAGGNDNQGVIFALSQGRNAGVRVEDGRDRRAGHLAERRGI